LTEEAIKGIAETTIANLDNWQKGTDCQNEIKINTDVKNIRPSSNGSEKTVIVK
jgi:hypothetical protein